MLGALYVVMLHVAVPEQQAKFISIVTRDIANGYIESFVDECTDVLPVSFLANCLLLGTNV